MDMPHDLGPLPKAPDIQEFEVGLIRMPADNSLLGVAHFRVYVRHLNPDGAIMHARIALPEAIREQCYFNVKPWPHQEDDEQVKRSLGVGTLAERVMAPEPTFNTQGSTFSDWDPYKKMAMPTDTANTVALLERFRERCAKEGDSEVESAQKCNRDGYYAKVTAKHIRQIDVADWVLQDSFTVGITEKALFAGLGVPREYIEEPALKPAFAVTVDQTGVCIRVSVNDRPIGIIQSLQLMSEVRDSDTVPRMWGKITFFSYPGMPEKIKQDRQMLRALPWMLIEELDLKNE